MSIVPETDAPASSPRRVVYGISRWTSANRPRAYHIPTEDMQPLCGDKRAKAFCYEYDEGEVTCAACLRIEQGAAK